MRRFLVFLLLIAGIMPFFLDMGLRPGSAVRQLYGFVHLAFFAFMAWVLSTLPVITRRRFFLQCFLIMSVVLVLGGIIELIQPYFGRSRSTRKDHAAKVLLMKEDKNLSGRTSGWFLSTWTVRLWTLSLSMRRLGGPASIERSPVSPKRPSGRIVDAAEKARVVNQISLEQGILLDQTVVVGDGANDALMLGQAGLGIAYNANTKLDQAPARPTEAIQAGTQRSLSKGGQR